jgi:hypothetical protein
MDLQSKYKNAIQLVMVTNMSSTPTLKREHWTWSSSTEQRLRAQFDRRKRSVLSAATESCLCALVLPAGTLRIEATLVITLYEGFLGGKLVGLSLTFCASLASRLDSTGYEPLRGRLVDLLLRQNDVLVLSSVSYQSMSATPLRDTL